MDTLLTTLENFFLQHGLTNIYWIAYSGGLDSQVLLFLCYQLRFKLPLKLKAVHVNHALSPFANTWSEHCAAVCQQLKIDFLEKKINLDLGPGDSLEEKAREARYQVFSQLLADHDYLLTAHQQDDQAETLFLQLMRGTGLKGLAAMPLIKSFAKGWHARPLLGFSRKTLKQYATEEKLTWVEDESNNNIQLTRNLIRQQIFPLLQHHWPGLITTLSRTTQFCAEAQNLLDEFASTLYQSAMGTKANTLSVKMLLTLSPEKQRLLLRYWIQQAGHTLPDSKKIFAIQHFILTAKPDRRPVVHWQNTQIRRYEDDLYILSQLPVFNKEQSLTWDFTQPLHLPGLGLLTAHKVKGKGLRGDINHVTVRFRQGGEKIQLANRRHQTLKNILYTAKVPPWERDRIPLLYIDETLVAIVDHGINDFYQAKTHEDGYFFELKPNFCR